MLLRTSSCGSCWTKSVYNYGDGTQATQPIMQVTFALAGHEGGGTSTDGKAWVDFFHFSSRRLVQGRQRRCDVGVCVCVC